MMNESAPARRYRWSAAPLPALLATAFQWSVGELRLQMADNGHLLPNPERLHHR